MTDWTEEITETEPDTEGGAGAEEAGGAPGPAVAESPLVAPGGPGDAERLRLLAARAELVERRRVIVSGKARDDYNRAIERIDTRLRRTDCLAERGGATVCAPVRIVAHHEGRGRPSGRRVDVRG